jgi:hypothetical protein
MMVKMAVMSMWLLMLLLLILVMGLLCARLVEHDQRPLCRHIVCGRLRAPCQPSCYWCSRSRITKCQKGPCAISVLAVSNGCCPVLPRVSSGPLPHHLFCCRINVMCCLRRKRYERVRVCSTAGGCLLGLIGVVHVVLRTIPLSADMAVLVLIAIG